MKRGPLDSGVATREMPLRPSTRAGIEAVAAGSGGNLSGPPAVAAALHAEEVARMRGWALAVLLMAASALAFTPALPGDLRAKVPFVTALLAVMATALWVWVRCRDERNYTPRVFRVFGWVAATVSFELVWFLGVFSPTPVVLTLGVTFVGLGRDRWHAVVIPLYAVLGYAVLASLVAAGVVEDTGVIRAPGLALAPRLFGVIMVPIVLLMTLGLARLSRRTLEEAARRSNEALRLAAQRAAQLAEANEELEGALRVGRGEQGRWTGARAGDWRLGEIIGRGAMGEIYGAHHEISGAQAAVKLLRADAADDERLLERFVREGRIASTLDTPYVVRVHDTGRVIGGSPYIAMELLEGDDLARVLRRVRVLDRAGVLELATQVARGLDAAHAAGIVHRDLKPQNLFRARVAGGEIWKILDFGVSTLAGSSGTLTQAGVVGTPAYMAPEQARSLAVDHRCDVFALGTVLYRALVGRPAFHGADTPQIMFDVVYRMPDRPGHLVDGLTRDIEHVLAVALAKKPDERFGSAGELAVALEAAFRGAPDRAVSRRAESILARHDWGRSLAP